MKQRALIFLVLASLSVAIFSGSAEAKSAKKALTTVKDAVVKLGESVLNVFVDTEATVNTSPTRMNAGITEVIYINDLRAQGQVSKEAAGKYFTVGIED